MASGKAASNKDMNGLKVVNLGAPTANNDAATKSYTDTIYTNAISRANHTGSQTASTISDFDTQVRTSRLDQMAVPTATVNFNNQRAANQADPTSAQDSATKNYVDSQIAGLVSGQTLKGTVRAAVGTNVNVSSPGATLDGLTAAAGDVFLLTGQSTASENGPWVWNGASSAMTRASNWDTTAEAVLGSYWVVREGTRADNFALLTNDTAVTLGTTALTFTFISVAGASIGRYNENCPATAAGGTWTITHNLNSTDVVVQIKRVASPFDFIDVYVNTPTANTATVQPDIAFAAGEYRAIVKY